MSRLFPLLMVRATLCTRYCVDAAWTIVNRSPTRVSYHSPMEPSQKPNFESPTRSFSLRWDFLAYGHRPLAHHASGDACELHISRRQPLSIFVDCSGGQLRSTGNPIDLPGFNLVPGLVWGPGLPVQKDPQFFFRHT